jgi:hypothetical protein
VNFSRFSHSLAPIAFQALANLFFLLVIFRYALGGWETAQILLTQIGWPAWIALAVVCALVLYRSDYRADVPLFIAAYALGYRGEWWARRAACGRTGITRRRQIICRHCGQSGYSLSHN